MKDEGKTKTQLIDELAELRRKVTELENQCKQEETLQISEALYRELLEKLPQKIFYKDRNSTYIYCNENYAHDLKIKPAEIVGKTDYDFYTRELAEKYRADDERIMESGKTKDIEERYIQNGQEAIVHTVKTPLKDEKGNTIGILGIFWDITERKKVEKALEAAIVNVQEEKNKSDAIIAAIGDGIIIQDTDYKIIYQNQIQNDLYGNRVGEYCYKTYEGRDTICEGCPIELSFKDGKIHKTERIVATDNGILCSELTGSSLKDSTGKIIAGIKVVRDISESKRIEEALRESEEKYRVLFEAAPIGIGIADLEGNMLDANLSMQEMTGFTLEELRSTGVGSTYVDPDERMLLLKTLQETGKMRDWEVRLKRKDGTIYYALLNADLLELGGHKVLLTTARDITDRKRAEKEKERLLKAIDSSTDGITITDEKDRFIYVNEAYAMMFGYYQQELIGKTWHKITPPEMIAPTEKGLSNTMHNKDIGTFCGEVPGLRKDGTIIPTEVRGKGFWDEKGNYQGHICIVRDITERKRAEEALRRAHEELEIRVHERTAELVAANNAIQEWTSELEKANETLNAQIIERERAGEELLKLRLGIERSNEAIFITDINGTIVYINPSFEKIYGYSREEALGKTPRILKSGVLPQEVYTQFWDTLLAKKVVTGEIINKTRDGRLLNIESSANPILDKDGNITGFLTIQHDITERKLSEAALRESEERYRKLVEFSPDAIAIHSEGKIVFINAATAKLFGAANPEQLIGKPVMDFVHPDYREIVKERIRQMIEEGKNVSLTEEKFVKLDGSVIDVEVTAMPFTYQSKPGVQVIIRNITDRKSAEEALQQSEEKYRTLIDNIQDGVFIIQDANVQFVNEAFARMVGYTVEEVIGKDFRELVAPEDLEMVADRYHRRQAGEDVPNEYEFHTLHKDGRTRILVNMNVGLITFRGWLASMGTVKDITEKKKLEWQLLRAQRMESIGTLASGIAHDINNVLTPIMLSQELLQGKFTDEESRRLLSTIERSTQRGANLMKQIMSYARGVEGERNALQVSHLTSEIRQIAKETFPRNIEIRTDTPKDLWTISGDATQLHQVIMNLCVNARDAMSDGGILSISAENLFVDESYARMNTEARIGPYIVITVSDTGTGIPPSILDRIFEPFFTTKEHGKGTGLGLSTSLGIVKSHGGFITVYSEVGKGTAFKVYLPAIKTTETLKAEEHQHELPVGHGESILVVDDEAQIREITKKTLETHGYKVITANDGKEAVALYSQHREMVKAVLMDMMMPVMDGPASILELHKIDPGLKIIGVSGLTEKDKLAKVDDAHIQAFLSKPYAAERLLKTIHDIISTK